MKKHERTRLENLLQRRTHDALSEEDTKILIRLSAKRATELHQQSAPQKPTRPLPPAPRGFASPH